MMNEKRIVNIIVAVSPWLAPVIPASMAYTNMVSKLGFPAWVALVGAAVIECLGISTISTALDIWTHNKRYKDAVKKAPILIPVFAFVFYSVLVLTVNVIMEIEQAGSQIIARALLSLMTVPAAMILAARKGLADIQQELANDRQARKMARQADCKPLADHASALDTRGKLLRYYASNPQGAQGDAAIACGVSRSRVGQLLKQLETDGVISRNGTVKVV